MKSIVLLCDSYPLSAGEFFLDDEIKIIHSYFEKIYVVIKEQEKQELKRFTPNNIEITKYKSQITTKDKFRALPKIFSILFISELFRTVFKFKIAPKPILFKIMFMDIVKSGQIIYELNNLIGIQDLDLNNTIFYSYWHDYRALALSRLSKQNKVIKAIARAHGWDVFANRHKPPYLPYKKFVLDNLSATYSISETGREEFYNYSLNEKIKVSKLGKINNRIPLYDKPDDNKIIICSCSNIIPLKRIDKIIDLISKLNIKDLNWIHFGDGYLREGIEIYAKEKFKKANFEFKGIVPNNAILDFYADNYIDLFVNLSESEGIPVSIMEALSAGIPVLATGVGGTAEAVNDKNGFLIPKDFVMSDVVEIVEKYLQSSSENQLNYRKNAYDFWKENFEATKNYTQFANELLNI